MSLLIKVKDSCGTYNASAPGHKQKASCTSGRDHAAKALAVKIFGVCHSRVSIEETCIDVDSHWLRVEKLDRRAK